MSEHAVVLLCMVSRVCFHEECAPAYVGLDVPWPSCTRTRNSQHSHTRPYTDCTLPYMCLHTVMCDRVRTGTQQHRPTHLLTLRGTRLTCHQNDLASRLTPSALPRGPNMLCIVKCISPENTRGVLTSIPFVVYVTFIIVLYYHGIAAMLYDYEPKTQTHWRACLLQWRGMLA